MAGLTDSGLQIERLPEILAALRAKASDVFQDQGILLSEYYSESKYSENGKNFIVISAGKNQRDYFDLFCVVCQAICKTTAASVLSGRVPCKCSAKKRSTPENKLHNLLKTAKLQKVIVYSDSVETAKSKLLCECGKCGYFWKSSYNSLYYKKSGCPKCNNSIRKEYSDVIPKLISDLKARDIKLISINWQNSGFTADQKANLSCGKCHNKWQTKLAGLFKGDGCPACAKYGYQKSLPSFLYVARIVQENQIIGYKYGLTSDLHRRMLQHNKLSKLLGIKFIVSYSWFYEDGLAAFNAEKELKKTFKSPFNSKSLPSGSTEAISPHDLGELLDIRKKQYMEYLNGRVN